MDRRPFFGAELAFIMMSVKKEGKYMNRATPSDNAFGLPDQAQSRSVQVFYTDRTVVSLPDREELLSLLLRYRIPAPAKNAVASSEPNLMLFLQPSDYENG